MIDSRLHLRTMESGPELRAKIVGKAAVDEDFRARLISDPKGAIEQEFDVHVPASLTIKVHQESDANAHLVLPPDSKLNENDLRTVTAAGNGLVSDDGGRTWREPTERESNN